MAEQKQVSRPAEPRASRPRMPEGYGVPESDEGVLAWNWATERLESAVNYWIGTVRPDGRPHAAPVWGVWVDGAFYFEGGPDTRRGRNIAANPAVVVHIEQGDDIVIIEGTAEETASPDRSLAERLADAFGGKYEPRYGYRPDPDQWREGGLYVVRPRVAFAWSKFPGDATRFVFD